MLRASAVRPDAAGTPFLHSHSLLDETRQFELLVQGVTDYALYLLDATGHIVSWNPGGERIKGYSQAEVIGRHFSLFYTEEDIATGEPQRALQVAATTGKYEKEGWRARKDGTRFWASVVIDPIFEDGNLIGFAKITRDITERKQAQESLEKAQRAWMQSQKMEAIGQLTFGLAHDFNNLLTVIANSLDRIASNEGDPARIAQSVAAAQRAADRGALLTQQLLTFSRGKLLRATSQDLNAIIRASEPLLRRACDATIEIDLDLQPGLPNVAVDASQFEAAMLNLIVNARDAIGDGGRIRVSTRLREVRDGEASVVVSVQDDGAGMTPEVAAKALDPFFTTKEVGKGSGLGLSQVYGVVSQAGGTITISSTPGSGTTITLTVPACEEQPSLEATRQLKILMVDDDANIMEVVVDTLRDQGFDVVTAKNAQEALALVRDDATIDVLFTDIVMPGDLSGIDLANEAAKLQPGLKVLLASGYSESWLEGIPDFCEFIRKPYRIGDLKQKLGKYTG